MSHIRRKHYKPRKDAQPSKPEIDAWIRNRNEPHLCECNDLDCSHLQTGHAGAPRLLYYTDINDTVGTLYCQTCADKHPEMSPKPLKYQLKRQR